MAFSQTRFKIEGVGQREGRRDTAVINALLDEDTNKKVLNFVSF